MKKIGILILTCFLFACRTDKDDLNGHWHSLSLEDDFYWTLDITDSTTIVNKLDVQGSYQEYPRYNQDGKEIIIFPEFEVHEEFEVKGDSLFLNEFFKFIRVDEDIHLRDHFVGTLVSIDLPKLTTQSRSDLLKDKQWTSLFIGQAKNQNLSDDLMNLDSTFIQVADILIGFGDIKKFAKMESDKWSNSHYNLVIHADSITNPATIDSLLTLLKPFDFIDGFFLSKYNYTHDRMEFDEVETAGTSR
ncbi:MAG: hypothetical protein ABJG78_13190 [Cyclobacteriaceae bacterium]